MQAEDLLDLRQLGVLLFGDSVDFRFLKFFCEFALDQEPKPFTFSDNDWLKLQGVPLPFPSVATILLVWSLEHTCNSPLHEPSAQCCQALKRTADHAIPYTPAIGTDLSKTLQGAGISETGSKHLRRSRLWIAMVWLTPGILANGYRHERDAKRSEVQGSVRRPR